MQTDWSSSRLSRSTVHSPSLPSLLCKMSGRDQNTPVANTSRGVSLRIGAYCILHAGSRKGSLTRRMCGPTTHVFTALVHRIAHAACASCMLHNRRKRALLAATDPTQLGSEIKRGRERGSLTQTPRNMYTLQPSTKKVVLSSAGHDKTWCPAPPKLMAFVGSRCRSTLPAYTRPKDSYVKARLRPNHTRRATAPYH